MSTNRLMAAHLVRKVRRQDVDVVFADSGAAAISVVSKQQLVDLVLMDLKMPGMDGMEATRRIRQLPSGRRPMRIVGVTGNDDSAVLRECTDAGMDFVLTKPLLESQLRLMLPPTSAVPITVPTVASPLPLLFDDSLLNELDVIAREQVLADWKAVSLQQLGVMRTLCSSGDWKQLEDVAHSLKGSAAQLGARRLSQVAARAVYIARSDTPSAAQLLSLVDELDRVLTATLSQLCMHQPQPPTNAPPAVDVWPKPRSTLRSSSPALSPLVPEQ
jgi:CheY-like chemotaxis protein